MDGLKKARLLMHSYDKLEYIRLTLQEMLFTKDDWGDQLTPELFREMVAEVKQSLKYIDELKFESEVN